MQQKIAEVYTKLYPVKSLLKEVSSGSNTLLGKPLVFGDVEQIMALKAINRVTANSEGKTKYKVTYEVTGYIEVEVEATNELEAKEFADDDVDIANSLNNLSVDYDSIEEIEEKS